MSLPIAFRREASTDAEQIRSYLEAQQPGLGTSFLHRLNELLNRISRMPEIYNVIWQDVRAARLKKFMYIAYYRIHADRIEVLGVLH